MSARKISNIGVFQPLTVQSPQTRLDLAPSQVRVRKNGVEFRSHTPIAAWTEMTVTLQSNREAGKVHCTGVVVACAGDRHSGYTVSMVFTSLSKQAQARLNQLAYS
jgi:hypothetical protein